MTINCLGNLIDVTSPKIMGILNVTPDSFFDGGSYKDEQKVLSQTEKMLQEGATFIDVGAYSSRPGADFVTLDEELKRIVPIVKLLVKEFPEVLLSIDTFRGKVAEECIGFGAALINDISAGKLDEAMLPTIAKCNVPYIMMHMRGTPQTMQQLTDYDDLIQTINYYFAERIAAARALGIKDILIDPGFGFAKTTAQNFELLSQLDLLQAFNVPILAGISRKSMIYKTLGGNAGLALNGTTALHMVALQKGSKILRVHDVKEAKECIILHEALQKV